MTYRNICSIRQTIKRKVFHGSSHKIISATSSGCLQPFIETIRTTSVFRGHTGLNQWVSLVTAPARYCGPRAAWRASKRRCREVVPRTPPTSAGFAAASWPRRVARAGQEERSAYWDLVTDPRPLNAQAPRDALFGESRFLSLWVMSWVHTPSADHLHTDDLHQLPTHDALVRL